MNQSDSGTGFLFTCLSFLLHTLASSRFLPLQPCQHSPTISSQSCARQWWESCFRLLYISTSLVLLVTCGVRPLSCEGVHPNSVLSWSLHSHTYSQPTDWLVAEAGYPVESHDVVTEDGYILTVHRLPAPHSTGSTVHTVQSWLVTCHWVI